jgi:hypothetical protein
MAALSTGDFIKEPSRHPGAVSCFQPVALANDPERRVMAVTAAQLMDCGVGFALCCQALKQLLEVWAHLKALGPYSKSDVESESGMNYIYCFRHFDTSNEDIWISPYLRGTF